MLFKSGDNLWSGALDFISESEEVTLFSAYIRTEQLKELNRDLKINRIVVRWEIRDLHQGASDLDLYDYCKKNDIALHRNTRIHLKCMINESDDIFLGSANITGRGIGEIGDNYNFELNSINSQIEFSDFLYLNKILAQSEYVTQELYLKIKNMVVSLGDYKIQEENYNLVEEENLKYNRDFFLISELPMYMDVQSLYDAANNAADLSNLDKRCISHDLATFNVDHQDSEEQFYQKLQDNFNNHPFILGLKEEIKREDRKYKQSMRYGMVVAWIKDNTTSVPTPISWELKEKQVVNILYNWICFFDSNFVVERPGHTEVISFRP